MPFEAERVGYLDPVPARRGDFNRTAGAAITPEEGVWPIEVGVPGYGVAGTDGGVREWLRRFRIEDVYGVGACIAKGVGDGHPILAGLAHVNYGIGLAGAPEVGCKIWPVGGGDGGVGETMGYMDVKTEIDSRENILTIQVVVNLFP